MPSRAVEFLTEVSVPAMEGQALGKRMTTVMRDWSNQYLSRLVSQNLSGRRGDMGLNRRTGNLARDWAVSVSETPVGAVAEVKTHGTANAYAGLQERGGTIKPINAKFLWIPIAGNLTSAGVARISPSQAMTNGGFFTNRRNGPGRIFWAYPLVKSKRNKAHDLVPLFVLVDQVTVKPRMGAESLFRSMLPLLETGILAEVEGAWNGN